MLEEGNAVSVTLSATESGTALTDPKGRKCEHDVTMKMIM